MKCLNLAGAKGSKFSWGDVLVRVARVVSLDSGAFLTGSQTKPEPKPKVYISDPRTEIKIEWLLDFLGSQQRNSTFSVLLLICLTCLLSLSFDLRISSSSTTPSYRRDGLTAIATMPDSGSSDDSTSDDSSLDTTSRGEKRSDSTPDMTSRGKKRKADSSKTVVLVPSSQPAVPSSQPAVQHSIRSTNPDAPSVCSSSNLVALPVCSYRRCLAIPDDDRNDQSSSLSDDDRSKLRGIRICDGCLKKDVHALCYKKGSLSINDHASLFVFSSVPCVTRGPLVMDLNFKEGFKEIGKASKGQLKNYMRQLSQLGVATNECLLKVSVKETVHGVSKWKDLKMETLLDNLEKYGDSVRSHLGLPVRSRANTSRTVTCEIRLINVMSGSHTNLLRVT